MVENDLNAATWGAHVLSGADDLAYLALGTGLAAGFVLSGTLRRGAHGAAGEIGHVPVDPARRALLVRAARLPGAERLRLRPVRRLAGRRGRCRRPRPCSPRPRRETRQRSPPVTASPPGWRTRCGCSAWRSTRPRSSSAAASRTWASRCWRRSPRRCAPRPPPSPFLAALDLADRIRLLPGRLPVGAIGAALIGNTRMSAPGTHLDREHSVSARRAGREEGKLLMEVVPLGSADEIAVRRGGHRRGGRPPQARRGTRAGHGVDAAPDVPRAASAATRPAPARPTRP